MILGEIKGAKLSFSPDFQTLIKHKFPFLYFLYELLMSLRCQISVYYLFFLLLLY